MTIEQAVALALTLRRMGDRNGAFAIRTRIEFAYGGESMKNAKVVFSGGVHGEHEIWLSVSSAERIIAHFEGYCEASGMLAPEVGQKVDFPSASAWSRGGYRSARVISIGPKRALVGGYKYGYGGEGAPRHVPISDLKFAPRRPSIDVAS